MPGRFLHRYRKWSDVGMVERGGGLRFALEACQGLRILGDFVRKKLQGHKTMQAGVFGPVDNAHAAATELFNDSIVGDALADHAIAAYFRRIIGGNYCRVKEVV